MGFYRTVLLTFTLSTPVLANSEEEGQDMFQRGFMRGHSTLEKAAKAGDAGASYRLSVEFSNGNAVKRDMQLALEYLEASVEGDDPRGLQDMGSLYDEGIFGYQRNLKKPHSFICAPRPWAIRLPCSTQPPFWSLVRLVPHKTGRGV